MSVYDDLHEVDSAWASGVRALLGDVRFVAVAPFEGDTQAASGALIIADTAPRALGKEQRRVFADLATLLEPASSDPDGASHYEELLESLCNAFISVRSDRRVTYMNGRAEELLQRHRSEIIGRRLEDAFPWVVTHPTYPSYIGAIKEQRSLDLEPYFEGLKKYFRIHVRPVNGGVSIYFDDVTELRERERTLQRQRDLLDQAQRIAGAWEVDIRRENPAWTEKMFEIFGVDPVRGALHDEVFDLFVAPHRERIEQAFTRCFQEGEPYDLRLEIETPGGTRKWVRSVGAPVEFVENGNGSKEVVRIAGALQDITDLKNAEDQLKQRERDLREAHRIARIGSWYWDLQNDRTRWSTRKYEIFGVDPETEITYEKFLSYVHEGDRERVRVFEEGIRGTSAPDNGEISYRIIQPSGNERVVLERSELERDAAGDPLRVVGIVRDVTAETLRERELIRAREQAEEMHRLKSRFLANMSHEIRTPLTSIIGFAELATEMDLEAAACQCVDAIYNSSRRLFSTLTSVLDLSQLEAGTLRLHPEPVNVPEIIEDVLTGVREQARSKGVELRFRQPAAPIPAMLDRGAIQRVLANLIGNAVKFTDEGSVSVSFDRQEGDLRITVQDTGVGIDESFLPHLFDPFRQESDGDSRLYEGSGLGLAISKDLVELMDGTIEVTSRKGEGTRFKVCIPHRQPSS